MVRRALREALIEMLGENLHAEEVGSVAAAREVLARIRGDLLMLDLNMPGMDGMLGLNALRAEFPAVPILVVSGIDDPVVVRQTMEFGASGFLPKSAPFDSIGEAVGSLLAGELWFPEGLVAGVEPALNLTMQEAPRTGVNASHFGIQVASTDDVAEAKARFDAAGLRTIVEEETACCYAVQDKVWVEDPDGNAWEVFFVKGEADVMGTGLPATPKATGCCVPKAKSGCCP